MDAGCSPKELALIRLLAYVADRFYVDACFEWVGTSPDILTDHVRERFGIEATDFDLIPGLVRRGFVEEASRNAWNATAAGRTVANFGEDVERGGSLH
jgi:hypothetical protein